MQASNHPTQAQSRQSIAVIAASFLAATLVVISRESGADFAQDCFLSVLQAL